jgi:uncharacterized protein (DUF58 family)
VSKAPQQSPANLLDPAYLSSISNYALMARVAVEGYLSGLHRSRFQGSGSEFLQYRAYTPGEDPRLIDWKAYARRNRLQTKIFQEETNMTCSIILDSSASMDYRGSRASCSKFDYARMIAAALAYLALRQGDQVGLYLYNSTIIDAISPSQRSNRLASIFHALNRAKPAEHGDHERVIEYMGHHVRGRGLFVFISDMLDAEDSLPALLARIRIRHFDTVALQVLDPDELDFPQSEAARFVDMESGMECVTSPKAVAGGYNRSMREAQARLRKGFIDSRIDHTVFSTESSLGRALSAYLHRRNQLNVS